MSPIDFGIRYLLAAQRGEDDPGGNDRFLGQYLWTPAGIRRRRRARHLEKGAPTRRTRSRSTGTSQERQIKDRRAASQ